MSYPTEICAIAASYLMTFVSMYDHAGNGPNPHAGEKGLVFEDTFSDRSFSTHLLSNLGLIEPRSGYFWKCTVDKDETISFLSERGLSDAEREQLVGEYVMILCEWQGVPATRNEFILPAKAADFRATLIEHGLCEKRGGSLQWSKYAGPAMRSGRQWDPHGSSVSEMQKQAAREEAEHIWQLLPDGTKEMLVRRADKHSILVIWKLLRDHWDGKTWEMREHISPQVNHALAKAFLEVLLSRRSANRVSVISAI